MWSLIDNVVSAVSIYNLFPCHVHEYPNWPLQEYTIYLNHLLCGVREMRKFGIPRFNTKCKTMSVQKRS